MSRCEPRCLGAAVRCFDFKARVQRLGGDADGEPATYHEPSP